MGDRIRCRLPWSVHPPGVMDRDTVAIQTFAHTLASKEERFMWAKKAEMTAMSPLGSAQWDIHFIDVLMRGGPFPILSHSDRGIYVRDAEHAARCSRRHVDSCTYQDLGNTGFSPT